MMYLQQLIDKRDKIRTQLKERSAGGDTSPIARALMAFDPVDRRLCNQIMVIDEEIVFLQRIRDIAAQYADCNDYKFIDDQRPPQGYDVRLVFTDGEYACPIGYSLRVLDDLDQAAHIGWALGLTLVRYLATIADEVVDDGR